MTRQELERAVAALEANRAVLNSNVVDTAVAALQERLAVLAEPSDAAQRQLTVLIADLSGYTALSEALDAEQVRDHIDAIWQRLDAVIQSWGGVIDKHIGDGVIALFGLQDESDAELRAVRAALDMQLELKVLHTQAQLQQAVQDLSTALSLRVGINSGPVYWGQLGSSDQRTAIGDTVSTAEQIESLAPLGGTLVTHPVYRQVREFFDVASVAKPALAADPADTSAVYVVHHEKQPGFMTGISIRHRDVRLVGRDEMLMLLQQAVQESLEGGFGQQVTISGELGSGKTRLIYELQRLLLMGPNVQTWYGRVPPALPQVAGALFRDLLARRFQIRRWQHGPVARDKLALGLDELGVDYNSALLEGLNRCLSFGGMNGDDGSADDLAPLIDLLTAVSRQQPMLLVLDDLRRADAQTLAQIDRLVEATRDVPLVIATVARAEPALQNTGPTQERWQPVRLNVRALSSIDTRHLLNELLAELPHLPLTAADLLVAITQGNPQFVMELVPYLKFRGVIVQDKSGSTLRLGRLQALPIPATLRGLYWERFSELQPEAKQLLQAAAIAGTVFWETELLPAGDRAVLLRSLQRQRIIQRRQGTYVAGSTEYAFTHDMWQQVAYESMEPAARRQGHESMAVWLASLPGNVILKRPLLIARHQQAAEQQT